jgi:hypothetical protein
VNADRFAQFLELTGHRIIQSASGLWCEMVPAFYESIPFHRTIDPPQVELDMLFRNYHLLGIKYRTRKGSRGKRACIYICDDKVYDMKSLHPKMRNKARQGLKNCVVREMDLDDLYKHGLHLNTDTLSRQGRKDAAFSRPAQWARFCDAGKQVEGASAWGAFVGDQLAAYMVTFITGECCSILYQYSCTDLLHTKANNALAYVVTREMLSSSTVSYVSYGQRSIRGDQPGLDEYKVRLGYKRQPVDFVVILHPLLKLLLLGRLGDGLLGLLSRVAQGSDVLKRVRGIVDIAKQS